MKIIKETRLEKGPIKNAVSRFVVENLRGDANGDIRVVAEELADAIHFGLTDAVEKMVGIHSDEVKTYLINLHRALEARLSKNGLR